MKGIRRHLSYANVTATLALVLAMSGGAIAASGGFSSGGKLQACVNGEGVLRLLKPGKHCARGQQTVAWNQQGPAGAPGANGAAGAPGAQGATGPSGPSGIAALNGAPVPDATTSQTADNALALGGIPASGFTHSDCASTTGQIKGFALVPAVPQGGWIRVSPSYNCSGQAVEALEPEPGAGIYIVRFQGNPAEIAMATAVDVEPLQGPGVASVKQLAPGEFEVYTASPSEQLAQQAFELLLP
ncbi:MAG TPA: hypothetical protein VK781_05795 [Solirubrobacteraceae bacterium]|jgi:hypothetical protein|nr:hypothetical protein [Solirubrobacteraceae bacterium]